MVGQQRETKVADAKKQGWTLRSLPGAFRFLEGQPLDQWIEGSGPDDVSQILRIGEEIGHGAIGCIGVEFQRMGAMHLLQKHRPHAQSGRQCLPVGLHMGRGITHMVTQVEAVPGRR